MHCNNSRPQKWLEGAKKGVGGGREAYIFCNFPGCNPKVDILYTEDIL